MDLNEAYGNVLIDLSRLVKTNSEAAEDSNHNAFKLLASGRAEAFEQARAIVRQHMDPIMEGGKGG